MSQNNKFHNTTAKTIVLAMAVVTGISTQDSYTKMSKTEAQIINDIPVIDSSYNLNAGVSKVIADIMSNRNFITYPIQVSNINADIVKASEEVIEEVKLAKDGTPYVYYEIKDSDNYYSMSKELQEYTYDLCVEYGITEYFTLILCQLYHESGYNSSAISSTNDYGIAQINQCNHKWLSKELGITDFLNAKQSILCNVYIMSDYLNSYGPESALVCYNTGKPYKSNSYARAILEMWNNDVREIQEEE